MNNLLALALVVAVLFSGPAAAQDSGSRSAVADDVRALVSSPTLGYVSLSPDGTRLAYVVRAGDTQGLLVRDRRTNQVTVLISFTPEASGAGRRFAGVHWKNDNRLLIQVLGRRALTNRSGGFTVFPTFTEFFAMNADGSNPVQIEGLGREFGHAEIIHLLPGDPDHVLLQGEDRDRNLAAALANVQTGETRAVVEGAEGVTTYFADSGGSVVARIRIAGSAGRWGLIEGRSPDGRWTRVADYFASDLRETSDFEFISSGPETGQLYAIVRPDSGSHPDTAAVHIYDFRTRSLGPALIQHPTYDMRDLLVDAYTGEPLAGCYEADMWRCDFTDPATARRMEGLLRFFDDERDIRVVSQDRSRRLWVLAVSGATEPGSYYLYDVEAQSVDPIDEAYGEMAGLSLAEMRRIDYTARDGQALRGYLTLPARAGAGPYPLIVMPHGGPEARDVIEFNPWVQYLAMRGYAVFQPNFRGSSGFGRAFAEAGYRQWGQRMQDDVTDGVQALIDQGTVDPGQICIMGASYGGYAALWGGARQSDLYRCVISIAGVGDLEEMLQWTRRIRGSRSGTFDYWETAIGELDRDRQQIRDASPIRYVDGWTAPVLLVHGTADGTVPVAQSEMMDAALRQAGRDVRFVELEGAGHSFRGEEYQSTLLAEVAAFLAQHLPTPQNRTP
ncbi:alpha/beta hydrolase family protein [Brevundimonas aveniformis]|uniref:alpha/beta hydrolase family protein n=1 Tax=Brevundimonas aveniformis TaxID=370977 RepID=UPI00248FE2F9|nr:S9 family peptidase [Brevundimonas aveniformis]